MIEDFWNSQLQFSTVIPGFAEALARMAQDSVAFAEGREMRRTAYGDHPRQWVEITRGTGSGPLVPVVVHGGYWRALEAENHRFMMQPLADLGRHVANVEYRLMPEVRMADVVADVCAGLDQIARDLPGARFLLVGHSAGAQLALSALRRGALDRRCDGIIALSGVFDLAPVAVSFLQPELQLSSTEVRDHSLPPGDDLAPVLFVNGSDETYELKRQSALMARGSGTDWHLVEGANHMSLTWMALDDAPALLRRLDELRGER